MDLRSFARNLRLPRPLAIGVVLGVLVVGALNVAPLQWGVAHGQTIPPRPTSASGSNPAATPAATIVSATPTTPGMLDWAIPGGHFYTRANGKGGGGTGCSVVDDNRAAF